MAPPRAPASCAALLTFLVAIACFSAAAAQKCICAQLCSVEGICGKDHKLYCSACLATAAGTSPTTPGPTCAAAKSPCNDLENPVCGKDGKSYCNPCKAYLAGTTIARYGACINSDGCKQCAKMAYSPVCDRSTNATFGNACLAKCKGAGEVETGACTSSLICYSLVYQPTCGIDAHTYGAPCDVSNAGTTVKHAGACTPADCGCNSNECPVCDTTGKQYTNMCQLRCAGGTSAACE